ncbi:uncharacterized protein LOC120131684 [Hibiscus syriacus]|uniref:uncharacterized protein LOC120131684 n=1 Tax=Hibiscus syriacus TaxID=106335 RepID=UPI001921667A|nr:uncharacterized protein LOC120131684 [Hibiscus syriacus]
MSYEIVLDSSLNDQISNEAKESLTQGNVESGCAKLQQCSKNDNGNSSAIHPKRTLEDENLDYDSNASSSSFEFHKGERAAAHNCLTRSYSRPMSSKWNDAEKWIMKKQDCAKKSAFHNQVNQYPFMHIVRVAPEMANYDHRLAANGLADTKRVDFYQQAVQIPFGKFSFIPSGAHPVSAQSCGGNLLCDQFSQSKDLKEVAQLSCTKSSEEDTTAIPAKRSVCMRDMGTEMTPVASQEPSRTATPVGETTPLRSPTYSIPSTPRRGAPTSTSLNRNIDDESQHCPENGRKALSEKETNLKTRRQIVALGVQLGKMNIASWESKDEKEDITSSGDTTSMEELERIEYEKRAAAWEEAEKSNQYFARYKREEIKIQAWESRQRAKLEAEMRRIKEKVDPMRIQAQAKMVKKIAMATQDQKKSEQQLKLERIEMQKEQLLKQNTFEKPEECHCLLTCVVVGCHNNRVDNQ